MAFVKLITLLLLPYLFAVDGKAISKRYVEHLLREGYTSDCDEEAPIAPAPLPTIIAARAGYAAAPIRYAEPVQIAQPKPLSPAFGYEFTVPVGPSTPLTMKAAFAPAPVNLAMPAAAITTDCSDVPALPLAPPAPEYFAPEPTPAAELPLPPLPPPPSESAAILSEPLKGDDCGTEVAAAPLYEDPLPAPQPLEVPAPPPLTIEAPAIPLEDEGCRGKILPLEFAEKAPIYDAKFLFPPAGVEGKTLIGIRYGTPKRWQPVMGPVMKSGMPVSPISYAGNEEWLLPRASGMDYIGGPTYGEGLLKKIPDWQLPDNKIWKQKRLLIRSGMAHPIQSGEFGEKLIDHNVPAGEWHLPMYRTGVSHPCQSVDEAKSKK